ncbi:hypothetical protein OQH60_08070 [Campylobacter sp. MIT 21-1685]|uniref:hypothetical protein n=1 Tax=unclassified Campylobacter TaxID=2593542 RepID=UPI00224B1FE2|nr:MULTISPECIES: hypothetical protein [unclassified Campylobacter]MCX2683816.1 hypothetical protein [Campylobacter sp. MIT 21-1684]MCX2752100.1 hypothetical protein [Campylobacter sp. MIT 21-1682]MCX2808293.1 hypothetical protein [Campylobacter sp. MIT 21-1685]
MKVLKFINDDTISHIALLLATFIPAFFISYQSTGDGFSNIVAIFVFSYFISIIITAILMMIMPPIALLFILPTWLIVISLDFILFALLKIYSFKNKTIKNS